MSKRLTPGEYAKTRDVSKTAVQNAIADGRISAAVEFDEKNRARIDRQEADRLWAVNTSRPSGTPAKLSEARAVKETYKARLAKLEFEQKSGELIKKEEVQAQAFRAGKLIKDSLMAIPARLSELVAAEDDAGKCRALIEKEIRQALEELSDGIS